MREVIDDEIVGSMKEYTFSNDRFINIYVSHYGFNMDGTQDVNRENEEDYYVVYSSDEDDTTSVDHLSDGEDEVFEMRTKNRKRSL